VLTAYSGEAALEVVQSERVDVVLLDVMMPGMDGFEVCRRLKTSTRTMHVPVVMVTALDQACDKVRASRPAPTTSLPSRWTTSLSSRASRIWPVSRRSTTK